MAIDQQVTPLQIPSWVPRLLTFAAVYNLASGGFVILFPTLPFRLAGMEPPNYTALVQGLGCRHGGQKV